MVELEHTPYCQINISSHFITEIKQCEPVQYLNGWLFKQ